MEKYSVLLNSQKLCLVLSVFLFFPSLLRAELTKTLSKEETKQVRMQNASIKNRVWSLELAMLRYLQEIDSQHSLDGSGVRISMGYGMITRRHFILGDVNLYIGPFKTQYKTAQYDYTGLGASISVGTSFESTPLRGNGLGIGMLAGIGYQDFRGKFYGRNDTDDPAPHSTTGIVTSYGSKISSIDFNFGCLISWMSLQRYDTHDEENLMTRNEGMIASLQASIPFWSRFRGEYQVLDTIQHPDTVREKGFLEGFKVILSLRAFLGS